MLKHFLLLILLILLINCEQQLLKMSQQSTCIKSIIDTFIQKQTCQNLTEDDKSKLSIKMTNCLNIKLGKQLIEQCEDLQNCNIKGQNWYFFNHIIFYINRNTFTTFFVHIDNLCHFYWQTLLHQRTQKLINSLSSSAYLAQNILNKNHKSTQKILQMQQTIKIQLSTSLNDNKILGQTLKHSQQKIQKMTDNLQDFFNSISQNMNNQYASILNFMEIIHKGMESISMVQNIISSQVSSIFGLLFYSFMIIAFGVITSFWRFKKCRVKVFLLIILNLIIQILSPQVILNFIGLKIIRLGIFILILSTLFSTLLQKNTSLDDLKFHFNHKLDTARIKRIFKQIIQEKQIMIENQKKENQNEDKQQ